MRNARDEADVVLYLVNASEDPAGAAYVPLEMEVLDWVGKPIVLLLNQIGPPGEAGDEDEQRWRTELASNPLVRGHADARRLRPLLGAGTDVARDDRAAARSREAAGVERLIAAWTTRNVERFHASMGVLAEQLGEGRAGPRGDRRRQVARPGARRGAQHPAAITQRRASGRWASLPSASTPASARAPTN